MKKGLLLSATANLPTENSTKKDCEAETLDLYSILHSPNWRSDKEAHPLGRIEVRHKRSTVHGP